jgi:hypothetical protein
MILDELEIDLDCKSFEIIIKINEADLSGHCSN